MEVELPSADGDGDGVDVDDLDSDVDCMEGLDGEVRQDDEGVPGRTVYVTDTPSRRLSCSASL